MKIRKATVNDIDMLVALRKIQLVDEGQIPRINIDKELTGFFQKKMTDGTLTQWIVENEEEIMATGAVIFYDFPPSFTNKTGKRAYIANMYTKKSYRGQGIATNLLKMMIKDIKETGVTSIFLIASEMGRPVYKKIGFKDATEFLKFDL